MAILIVDDSPTIRSMVRMVVSPIDTPIEAIDGMDAWGKLNQLTNNIKLVICDINMPNLRGDQLAQRISANPALRRVPLIIVSTDSDKVAIPRASAILKKPFKPKELLDLVTKLHKNGHI